MKLLIFLVLVVGSFAQFTTLSLSRPAQICDPQTAVSCSSLSTCYTGVNSYIGCCGKDEFCAAAVSCVDYTSGASQCSPKTGCSACPSNAPICNTVVNTQMDQFYYECHSTAVGDQISYTAFENYYSSMGVPAPLPLNVDASTTVDSPALVTNLENADAPTTIFSTFTATITKGTYVTTATGTEIAEFTTVTFVPLDNPQNPVTTTVEWFTPWIPVKTTSSSKSTSSSETTSSSKVTSTSTTSSATSTSSASGSSSTSGTSTSGIISTLFTSTTTTSTSGPTSSSSSIDSLPSPSSVPNPPSTPTITKLKPFLVPIIFIACAGLMACYWLRRRMRRRQYGDEGAPRRSWFPWKNWFPWKRGSVNEAALHHGAEGQEDAESGRNGQGQQDAQGQQEAQVHQEAHSGHSSNTAEVVREPTQAMKTPPNSSGRNSSGRQMSRAVSMMSTNANDQSNYISPLTMQRMERQNVQDELSGLEVSENHGNSSITNQEYHELEDTSHGDWTPPATGSAPARPSLRWSPRNERNLLTNYHLTGLSSVSEEDSAMHAHPGGQQFAPEVRDEMGTEERRRSASSSAALNQVAEEPVPHASAPVARDDYAMSATTTGPLREEFEPSMPTTNGVPIPTLNQEPATLPPATYKPADRRSGKNETAGVNGNGDLPRRHPSHGHSEYSVGDDETFTTSPISVGNRDSANSGIEAAPAAPARVPSLTASERARQEVRDRHMSYPTNYDYGDYDDEDYE